MTSTDEKLHRDPRGRSHTAQTRVVQLQGIYGEQDNIMHAAHPEAPSVGIPRILHRAHRIVDL